MRSRGAERDRTRERAGRVLPQVRPALLRGDQEFTYDTADWLKSHLDHGKSDTDWTDNRKTENAAAHYARAAAVTGMLAISEEECRDVLVATLDGALWHRLIEERGWTDERFAEFLGSMWSAALVR